MQEVFEKIIKKLKEIAIQEDDPIYEGDRESDNYIRCNNAIEAVEQVAAEYDNGWIPCSERLPEENMEVIVTISEMDGDNHTSTSWLQDGVWIIKKTPLQPTVIAWQPLPEPYQTKEEQDE